MVVHQQCDIWWQETSVSGALSSSCLFVVLNELLAFISVVAPEPSVWEYTGVAWQPEINGVGSVTFHWSEIRYLPKSGSQFGPKIQLLPITGAIWLILAIHIFWISMPMHCFFFSNICATSGASLVPGGPPQFQPPGGGPTPGGAPGGAPTSLMGRGPPPRPPGGGPPPGGRDFTPFSTIKMWIFLYHLSCWGPQCEEIWPTNFESHGVTFH